MLPIKLKFQNYIIGVLKKNTQFTFVTKCLRFLCSKHIIGGKKVIFILLGLAYLICQKVQMGYPSHASTSLNVFSPFALIYV